MLKQNDFFNIETVEGDEHLRIYHSGLRLLDDGWQNLEAYKGVVRLDENNELPSVMEFALNIDGIVWVRLSAYCLVVRKSPMVGWEKINEQLLDLWLGIKGSLDLDKLASLPDTRPDIGAAS